MIVIVKWFYLANNFASNHSGTSLGRVVSTGTLLPSTMMVLNFFVTASSIFVESDTVSIDKITYYYCIYTQQTRIVCAVINKKVTKSINIIQIIIGFDRFIRVLLVKYVIYSVYIRQ